MRTVAEIADGGTTREMTEGMGTPNTGVFLGE